MRATEPSLIEAAARAHRELRRRAASTTADDTDAVLNLGAAVILHGVLERALELPRCSYVAAAVVEELLADHQRLAEDLGLLEELTRSESERRRNDAEALSKAVMAHLAEHLERDDRLLYGSLQRSSRKPPTRRKSAC
ncbi:MAG: hypothetical protein PVJ51_08365 [Acidobacteriota bacterium]|jgi:hypothetical protein